MNTLDSCIAQMQSDWMFRAVRFESTIFNSISTLCRTCCRARAIATNGFLKRKLAKQVLGFGLRMPPLHPGRLPCQATGLMCQLSTAAKSTQLSYGLHLEAPSLEVTSSFNSAR